MLTARILISIIITACVLHQALTYMSIQISAMHLVKIRLRLSLAPITIWLGHGMPLQIMSFICTSFSGNDVFDDNHQAPTDNGISGNGYDAAAKKNDIFDTNISWDE